MLRTLVASAFALLLSTTIASAQHNTDFWVGENSDGQITTTNFSDTAPVELKPSATLGGWADNNPGFDSILVAVGDLSPVPSGSELWLNVVSMSPGLEVITDGLVQLGAGDSGYLGGAGFHTHYTWHVHSDKHPDHDPLRSHWQCTFTLSDASGLMSDSIEHTVIFQNVEAEIGDVNQDGFFNADDHTAFHQVLADPAAALATERASADVNLDGYVTVEDECHLLVQLGLGGFVRGDTNADMSVNLADSVALLGYLFNGAEVAQLNAGDANADNAVDVADVIYVLSFLFQGGSQPPAPFPNPGC